ncbi:DUF6248 family natural product biosynthesis protein [Actinomyces culturomici]|uniref:DUF6248 family natural product biosynthesis protein n=1 Tax=Actinomyces culturomici TaxID=1926276 RepID=UPI000E20C206|nr:DUF6248 family natural product biosynthesis protein [Actinomyces culturomici]
MVVAPLVDEVTAEAIRESVWTPAMRKELVYLLHEGRLHCPCEYGRCGYCAGGRHDLCPYERRDVPEDWKTKMADSPIGWIGSVRGTAFGSAPFFDARIAHDERCACWRAGHFGADLPGVQLDLFDAFKEVIVCGVGEARG